MFIAAFTESLNARITPIVAYVLVVPQVKEKPKPFPRVIVRLSNRDREESLTDADLARTDTIELTVQGLDYESMVNAAKAVGEAAVAISGDVGTFSVDSIRYEGEHDDVQMLGDGSTTAVFERVIEVSAFYR